LRSGDDISAETEEEELHLNPSQVGLLSFYWIEGSLEQIILYSPDGYHGNLEKPQEHSRKLRIRKVKFKWITKVFGAIFLNLVNNHYQHHCRSTRRP
jgi:hypothetical protein